LKDVKTGFWGVSKVFERTGRIFSGHRGAVDEEMRCAHYWLDQAASRDDMVDEAVSAASCGTKRVLSQRGEKRAVELI